MTKKVSLQYKINLEYISLRSWLYFVIKVLAADPRTKKGSGDEAFGISCGFDARGGSAAKSHSTGTQCRQLRRLGIHVHTSSNVSPFQAAIMTLQWFHHWKWTTNLKGSILFSLDKLQWNEKSWFSRPIQMFILANSKLTVQDKSFKWKLKLLCYNNKKK